MSLCVTCNGWGVVLSISVHAPSTKEARDKQLKTLKANQHLGNDVKVVVCTNCGGYGQRPNGPPW
jgi:predicted metal-binding protein